VRPLSPVFSRAWEGSPRQREMTVSTLSPRGVQPHAGDFTNAFGEQDVPAPIGGIEYDMDSSPHN